MQVAIVFVILAAAVVLFLTEVLPIDVVALLMLLALALTGVVTPQEALSGFSDQAVLTIAGFFVVSAALYRTGVIEALGRRLYRLSGESPTRLLIATMLIAAGIASFMSNVVTTAVMMPAVIAIARRIRQPASQFLMPLSFGAVLGGKCTLVGSSTNLAVSGLLPRYNMPPFTLFEFAPLGIPMAIAGVLYMLLIGKHLLPKHPVEDFEETDKPRDFVTELVVQPDSPLAGRTLGEIDFRGNYDLRVVSIRRGHRRIVPHVGEKLEAGDLLMVQGSPERILSVKDAQGIDINSDRAGGGAVGDEAKPLIIEAIIAPNSTFVGRTLRRLRFPVRYGVDVLGIYRHHQPLTAHLGDVRLAVGDLLMLQGAEERINNLREDPNFITLDEVEHTALRKDKATWAVVIFLLAAVVAAFNLIPVALIALAAAAALVLVRCITIREAYGQIEWSAIVLIAATIPLGIAMEKTGAARILASYVTQYLAFGGPLLIMGGFFIFTVFLTQPMANAACALILTPVAINVANQLQINPRAFAVVIAIAASCTFPTPLEPVTAIVYEPGQYKFSDYIRVGGLLTVVVMIVTLLLVPIIWPLR